MKEAFERMYAFYARWRQPGERYDQNFEILRHERIIVGNSDQRAEEVECYEAEFEVTFTFFRGYWSCMEPEQALDAIRLFGQEVIARVKRWLSRKPPCVAETAQGVLPARALGIATLPSIPSPPRSRHSRRDRWARPLAGL
jgi:hypothetical protein